MSGDHRVIAASCIDPALGMAGLPDRSIDVVITDPPYSPKVHECSRRGLTDYKERKGARARDRRRRELEFAPLTPELRAACAREFARVVRRWVLVFSDHEGSAAWRDNLEAAGLEYVRTGAWIKLGSMPQTTGDRPAVAHECIVIAHQTSARRRPVRKRWNGGGRHALWSYPIVLDRGHTGARVHPTQKPLGLVRELVELFSEEGALVLDAFVGSGTTGIACRMTGRRFLGWEEKDEWAAMAQSRIDGAGTPDASSRQLDLLAALS